MVGKKEKENIIKEFEESDEERMEIKDQELIQEGKRKRELRKLDEEIQREKKKAKINEEKSKLFEQFQIEPYSFSFDQKKVSSLLDLLLSLSCSLDSLFIEGFFFFLFLFLKF